MWIKRNTKEEGEGDKFRAGKASGKGDLSLGGRLYTQLFLLAFLVLLRGIK